MVFVRYRARQTEFFLILDQFLPFYSSNNLENQNFKKMKETSGDIIILHKCTINDNHMMYVSWVMKSDRQKKDFWPFFWPFTPLTSQKIKILKKIKKRQDISWFYKIHNSQRGTKSNLKKQSHLNNQFPPEMTLLKFQQNFQTCQKLNFLFTPISNIYFKKFSRWLQSS